MAKQLFHLIDGRIEFHELEGGMWFTYRERVATNAGNSVIDIQQPIPPEVAQKGEEVIRQYAESEVKRLIDEQKAALSAIDAFIHNPNYPLEVEHGDIKLIGKIVSAEGSVLKVRLEQPFGGETFVIFGWASAMAGRAILDKDNQFSDYAIERAKGLLVKIYTEGVYAQQHTDTINTVNRLNGDIQL